MVLFIIATAALVQAAVMASYHHPSLFSFSIDTHSTTNQARWMECSRHWNDRQTQRCRSAIIRNPEIHFHVSTIYLREYPYECRLVFSKLTICIPLTSAPIRSACMHVMWTAQKHKNSTVQWCIAPQQSIDDDDATRPDAVKASQVSTATEQVICKSLCNSAIPGVVY